MFSESFEILKGALEVGKGKEIYVVKQGDAATIQMNERHYYYNASGEECRIKVTLSPGHTNFEHSLFIFKGLAKDGLASAAGVPKHFSNLALFVYLNNAKMVGLQKLAEPLFNYVARRV